jgi:hypothetical protein
VLGVVPSNRAPEAEHPKLTTDNWQLKTGSPQSEDRPFLKLE